MAEESSVTIRLSSSTTRYQVGNTPGRAHAYVDDTLMTNLWNLKFVHAVERDPIMRSLTIRVVVPAADEQRALSEVLGCFTHRGYIMHRVSD